AAGNWIIAVEHIGSTSIPNMRAKPTIDIAIGVTSLSLADQHLLNLFEKWNYLYLQKLEAHIPERRYLQKLDAEGRHLFHLHILLHDDELWKNHLRFRNHLISHPEEAKAYAALKRALKKKCANNREQYTLGKKEFVESILLEASLLEHEVPVQKKLTAEQIKLLTMSGRRKLVPEYLELVQSGAFAGGTDSSVMISKDRDQW
ncbi:MAG: GrpB family protein, partial [Verrucomicrobiota bacterium]